MLVYLDSCSALKNDKSRSKEYYKQRIGRTI